MQGKTCPWEHQHSSVWVRGCRGRKAAQRRAYLNRFIQADGEGRAPQAKRTARGQAASENAGWAQEEAESSITESPGGWAWWQRWGGGSCRGSILQMLGTAGGADETISEGQGFCRWSQTRTHCREAQCFSFPAQGRVRCESVPRLPATSPRASRQPLQCDQPTGQKGD